MNRSARAMLVGWMGLVLIGGAVSWGGVPLNNLEGVGGIAFNPLAYLAGNGTAEGQEGKTTGKDAALGLPQIGGWYVNLGDVAIDWTAIGVAETVFQRLEVSYGYETVAPEGRNIHKNNLGAKLLLVEENLGGVKIIPALAAGVLYKDTSPVAAGLDSSGWDLYVVASKLVTELPRPVLFSGGLLSTEGRATGVLGYDDDRAQVFFGNIDVLPVQYLAVGLEYRQGARFDGYHDADYWNAHGAWFANKNLTLVAAYVNAGNEESTRSVGLGDGVVVSAQYAF